jgi:hypothetical protein
MEKDSRVTGCHIIFRSLAFDFFRRAEVDDPSIHSSVIYWSSPLLFNKILFIQPVTVIEP